MALRGNAFACFTRYRFAYVANVRILFILSGSVKKFVFLVKNDSFLVRIQI